MGKDLKSIINQNEIYHVATEPALSNSLVPQCLNNLVPLRKRAFTLAEVLITLAIIGVVAVLTIPALIQNYNEKAWETAKSVFEKRLEVATRQMNTEEKLAGYSSTMDFVNELKNKIKITKVCDSSHLTDCFASKITSANNVVYETETDLAQLTKEDWGTGTVGVQFANGVNALISYNPNTTQDPYNNQFAASAESMAIIYDVSGYKNPNVLGKDINVNGNVKALDCLIKSDLLGGMCITKILSPRTGYSAMTIDECNQAKETLGITTCDMENDYWAGAVKACGGVSKMPNQDQLTQLANYIYNTDSISSSGTTTGLVMDTEKASQFLSASPRGDWGSFSVWSGQETNWNYVSYRSFGSNGTGWSDYNNRDSSNSLAVCLDQ